MPGRPTLVALAVALMGAGVAAQSAAPGPPRMPYVAVHDPVFVPASAASFVQDGDFGMGVATGKVAMANNELTLNVSRSLAKRLSAGATDHEAFARRAFEHVLARHPKPAEMELCREFLETRARDSSVERAREALVGVLFNHNEFITVR